MGMRGGTSKGGCFPAEDLPADKVALVTKSVREGVDVDYRFLQVFMDQPMVTDAQTCGNILAGAGPFAVERGLVEAQEGMSPVTLYRKNTGRWWPPGLRRVPLGAPQS